MMWSEKYRPKNIIDLVGNEEARYDFVEWFTKWKKGTKPILLVGPPGVGKTTLAKLAAKQFGYDMIELNASDVRNKGRIQEILQPILGSESLLGHPMIFIDEVDGIHGRADYGGAETLIKILKEPTVPILLAANSDISTKMKSIKKVVKTIRLRPLSPRMMQLYLNIILKKEATSLGSESLNKIVMESRGDLRSMINSVQATVTGFEPPTEKSFERLNIEEGINAFFKAKSIDEARIVLYSMHIDPRDKINAFYSSIITSDIEKKNLVHMLQTISKADMLYGKIMKTQNWRLLRYLDSILLGLYSTGIPIRYSQYNLSWPLLNRIRWDGRKIKLLASTASKNLHISVSTFTTFIFKTMLFCMKNGKLNFELDEEFDDIIEKEMSLIK
uniref:ATPase central domain-containing protein (RfcL) n=1 Tax=uncultured marine thaumarchaeote KM3_54_C03 TaxID=1456190 RepID=A0A075H6I4_9ARCH|nr:ATPase central domain-containing protein (rfcL) [uncultured marine thaumarchaeote KM3_54_C03]